MTAVAAPVLADFDLCGPLPSGTTVLEASAGTGKTYTIASLAARYLAEGEVELEPADAGHLRADGDQRAAAAGPGPAGHRRGGARRRAGRDGAVRRTTRWSAC